MTPPAPEVTWSEGGAPSGDGGNEPRLESDTIPESTSRANQGRLWGPSVRVPVSHVKSKKSPCCPVFLFFKGNSNYLAEFQKTFKLTQIF